MGLIEWEKLKKEGKIKISDEERDESSSRLGSEGLQSVRTDVRMPYIDSGYVEGAPMQALVPTTTATNNSNDNDEEFDEGPKIKVGRKKSSLSGNSRVAAFVEDAEDDKDDDEKITSKTNKNKTKATESSDDLEEGLESMANEAVKAFYNLFGGNK